MFSVKFQPKGRRLSQADLKPLKTATERNQQLSSCANLMKEPVFCPPEHAQPLPPICSEH